MNLVLLEEILSICLIIASISLITIWLIIKVIFNNLNMMDKAITLKPITLNVIHINKERLRGAPRILTTDDYMTE